MNRRNDEPKNRGSKTQAKYLHFPGSSILRLLCSPARRSSIRYPLSSFVIRHSSFVIALLLFALATPARAQDAPADDTTEVREVDLSADFLEGATENGESVRRLTGNVRLRQEETTLQSERAVEYPARNEILFTGNVRIVDEGDTLWADRVLYDRSTKVGRAEGNVLLSDGEVQLEAPSGTYYVDQKWAVLQEGVRMVDSTAVLTSRQGEYWLDEKRAEFYEAVRLVEDRSNLEADSVTYYRETEISQAWGNVFIEHLGGEEDVEADSTSRVYLFGDSAYHDNRAGFSRIEGRPLLVRVEEDTSDATVDTLMVRARVLESTRIDSLDRLIAIDSVRIWQKNLTAVADSVASERWEQDTTDTREEIRLFGGPVAWYEQSQVTGDTIVVKARSGSVDSLIVTSRAFVAQMDTVLGRIQQLRGRNLLGLFENDSLHTLIVGPNAEAIHYLKGEEDELRGAVRVSGDLARFRFDDGAIRSIKIEGDNEGTQYDAGLIPEPFTLEGFQWMPERRPSREGMIERAGDRLPPPPVPPAYTSVPDE